MKPLIISGVALLLMACQGAASPGNVILEDDRPVQRAGIISSQNIKAIVTEREDWSDDCLELITYNPRVIGAGDADIHSWQVTAANLDGTGRWEWSIAKNPGTGPAVLGAYEEKKTWLCGPNGVYRLDVVAYRDGIREDYQMQVEVR